jgi:hypothetical protein
MIQSIVRAAKRFAVLLPGVIIAYFSVRNVYPYLDRRLPVALAVLLTYGIGAYVLVPALLRIYITVRPPKHLPMYCVTSDGFASDPLNIGVIGSRLELITAMESIGWQVADPHTVRNIIRFMFSAIYDWAYPNAPISNLYLFGKKQDVAFQLQANNSTHDRHHVRFWATTYNAEKPLGSRSINWNKQEQHMGNAENVLWVGAASLDVGVGFIRHNLQFTHVVDPDTNQERELLVEQLTEQKLVKKITDVKLGKPYKLTNIRVLRGYLHADGHMKIAQLKPKKLKV